MVKEKFRRNMYVNKIDDRLLTETGVANVAFKPEVTIYQFLPKQSNTGMSTMENFLRDAPDGLYSFEIYQAGNRKSFRIGAPSHVNLDNLIKQHFGVTNPQDVSDTFIVDEYEEGRYLGAIEFIPFRDSPEAETNIIGEGSKPSRDPYQGFLNNITLGVDEIDFLIQFSILKQTVESKKEKDDGKVTKEQEKLYNVIPRAYVVADTEELVEEQLAKIENQIRELSQGSFESNIARDKFKMINFVQRGAIRQPPLRENIIRTNERGIAAMAHIPNTSVEDDTIAWEQEESIAEAPDEGESEGVDEFVEEQDDDDSKFAGL